MLRRALRLLRDGILSVAYPQECHVCGRPVESLDDGVVCAECWSDESVTTLLRGVANCLKCGAPLPSNARTITGQTGVSSHSKPGQQSCGTCSGAPFKVARSCGAYTGGLEASILFLKTHPHLCARLRLLLGETARRHRDALDADVVIPVPLHRLRERHRGFNQATIIARAVSAHLGLPLDGRSLLRVKQTERHRAGMDALDRSRSVQGAFEVVRPRCVEGAAILLADDLYTTGSTIASAARALLDAGANQVSVITIARVVANGRQAERGQPAGSAR